MAEKKGADEKFKNQFGADEPLPKAKFSKSATAAKAELNRLFGEQLKKQKEKGKSK